VDRRASSTISFRIGSGGAAPAVSCAACSAVLCAEIAVPLAHLFPRTGIFQCFSFIDFPTLRLLAASASRRREAGLLTRSSILSSLDAKRTNPQTPNLSTLARICLMAFQRFSFQHSWRARKKKDKKRYKMAGEAIVELSTLRLPSFSRQAPKHSGFSYTKR